MLDTFCDGIKVRRMYVSTVATGELRVKYRMFLSACGLGVPWPCRKAPKPMAAGHLWRKMAMKMTKPSEASLLTVKLVYKLVARVRPSAIL